MIFMFKRFYGRKALRLRFRATRNIAPVKPYDRKTLKRNTLQP